MANKVKLIELLDYGREEVRRFIAALSDEQRSARGSIDLWSAKDVVAHLTEWVARLVSDLELAEQPDAPHPVSLVDEPIDDTNAEIYAQHQGLSWEEVNAKVERSFIAIKAYAQASTESELDDPHCIPWREPRPLWQRLAGTAVEHPILHISYYHVGNGGFAEAARLQETCVSGLLELDFSPGWRGVQIYNLACIQALSGQKEKALANLTEAFRLAPELAEWSKQDTDLVGLRQDPAFQALHAA